MYTVQNSKIPRIKVSSLSPVTLLIPPPAIVSFLNITTVDGHFINFFQIMYAYIAYTSLCQYDDCVYLYVYVYI